MSNITELFESIKHDLTSVKQMYTLCDEYVRIQEPDENYPYFKKQLDTRIAEYKQTYPDTLIDTLVITGYKFNYKECGNCKESVSNISCYVNGIHVSIDVSWSDKYKMNIYLITISIDYRNDTNFKLYQSEIRHLNNRCDLQTDNWLIIELAKTGHTVSEFKVILQAALCS
jgi:hypothetical protein